MSLIREAIRQDAKQLAALQEQTFRDTFEALNTPADMAQHCATHYSTAMQEQEILNPDMITLVCAEQENLIGFTQLRFKNSPVEGNAKCAAEIQRLYVEKNWHGKGVAQQLMQAAISSVRMLGADQIWLGVWEKNPRAISFYKKFAFIEIGEHVFVLGSDAQRDIILRKNLEGSSEQG